MHSSQPSYICNVTATSFDIQCHKHLHERFQFLFEESLINEICKVGRLRKIGADHLVISVGDTITYMPIIVSGSLKVMTEDSNGDELLLYYLELGDTCAMTLNCCSREAKSTISALTEEESEILFIPVENMEAWMVKYKTWRNFVLESYNTRMNELLEAIDNLAFNNMEERLKKYLRDRAMVMHQGNLKITHKHIATDLNSSRVVISRLMKKLEIDGVIKQFRNRVEVLEFQD